MGVISYEVPINVQRMTIGVQGENNVREFLFDVTEWRKITGDIGAAEMVIQRRGDSSPYAAVITMHDENTVSWIPKSADTAKAGAGKIQLMWIANGKTVKTKIFDMKVDPSLDYAVPDTSLDPWASWMPGIINADANYKGLTSRVDDLQQRQTSPYNFKGKVAALANLPSSGNQVNDTYYVEAVKYRVTWTGDAWQQSSMEESKYTDELAYVKNDLDAGYESVDPSAFRYLPIRTVFENTWIDTNGVEQTSDGWSSTDFIAFGAGHTSICVYTGVRTDWVHFYNAEKTHLLKTYANVGDNWYDIPEGAVYIRLSNTDEGLATMKIYDDDKTTKALSSGYLESRRWLDGVWIDSNGTEGSDGNYSASEYIELPSAYTRLVVDSHTDISWCGYFDENKTHIKRLAIAAGIHSYAIPAGTKYIRISGESSTVKNTKIYGDGALINQLIDDGLDLPSYYDEHILEKVRKINLAMAESTAQDSYVFITDIHYPSNAMNSPKLIEDICRKTGITTVHLNGDYINRETVKADALVHINRICGLYQYPGVDTYITVGNHEYNNPSASNTPEALALQLSQDELRWPILHRTRRKITADPASLSYYYDSDEAKIRYFVGTVGMGTAQTYESQRWIASELTNVPAGYGVVVIYHTMLTLTNSTPALHPSAVDFVRVLDAAKNKTSVEFGGTTYDYSGKDFDMICALCGDYHLDMDYTTAGGLKIIMTTCDCWGQQWSFEDVSAPRQVGTHEEQAFDVVTINRTNRKITMTRIGAGDDREFSYD